MATSSFDERVVVTDPIMIEKMRRDLDNVDSNSPKKVFTDDKEQEIIKQWVQAHRKQ